MDLLPELSSLFDLRFLPKELNFLDAAATNALKGIYYKNYYVSQGARAATISFDIELVSYKVLRLGLPGTDFTLSINEEDFAPIPGQSITPLTTIPISGSYRWGILQYLPAYDIAQNPLSTAADLLTMADQLLGVSQNVQFSAVFEAFVERPVAASSNPSRLPQLQSFATTLKSHYPTLVLPTPLEGISEDDAAQEILAAMRLSNIEVLDVAKDLFILAPGMNATDSLAALDKYFKAITGVHFRTFILDLLIPEVSVVTSLAAAVEFPRSVLLPVRYDAETSKYVAKEAPARAKLNFAKGQFSFSSKAGFGYATNLDVSFPTDQPRVQIGQTGLQLEFTRAKLDLSERANIVEADADRRPQNFQGIYIDNATVYLPGDWQVQGNPVISAQQVLLGTGGLSGLFSITSGIVNGWLMEANLFNDVSVKFSKFDFAFSHNEVTSSNVTGIFTLDSFKRPDGSPATFNFDLLFSADGYRLAFESTSVTPAVTIKLGSVGVIHFTRLAIGNEAGEWYLDVTGDVELNNSLPIVGKVLPRKINVQRLLLSTDSEQNALDVLPIWADGTSISGNLSTGISITRALNLTILDAVKVDLLRFSLLKATNGDITALSTVNARLLLTPDSDAQASDGGLPKGFLAKVNNVGYYTHVRFPQNSEGGNVGPADVSMDFKLPDSVNVTINAGGIMGGGHLAVLNNGERYEGVLALTFRDRIKVNAFAILLDKLSNGEDGPSLLALIIAQFNPVQLGLGFTLNGVGGLIGLHRTMNINALRSGLPSGSLDKILFPAHPETDASQIVGALDAVFPPTRGSHTFGLMAQIGWGSTKVGGKTYSLLTLDAALLVELPAVRLALLGILRLLLPSPKNPVLKLRADFLGTVDFAAKKIAFDASLVDSSLLEFALTGDMAFRLYHGENPVFLLSTGGFHPAFQPPTNADLPTLRRLTLALANSKDLRIILTSYLALTSNTVQFGSRLDLFADLAFKFYVEGVFSFDVLFQFNPFHVEAQLSAMVAIKRKGSTKLGIYLGLAVSGPAPWHVVGKASVKVLGIKLNIPINYTFGRKKPEALPEQVDVHALFVQALQEPTNWQVELPTGTTSTAAVLRSAPQQADHLVIDPSGALTFQQKLVPLGYALEKYGNAGVAGPNQFELTALLPVDAAGNAAVPNTRLEETTDFFAPEQFRRMSDAQKLSAPSFQRMRNGYRLRGLDGYAAGAPVHKLVQYERVVLASTNADSTASQLATAAATTQRTPVRLDQATYDRLAKNSASNRSYQHTRPSARAPRPVTWQQTTYAVVYARDLAPYPASEAQVDTTAFANEAQATAYLQQQLASKQVQQGELLVVPTYQLELV